MQFNVRKLLFTSMLVENLNFSLSTGHRTFQASSKNIQVPQGPCTRAFLAREIKWNLVDIASIDATRVYQPWNLNSIAPTSSKDDNIKYCCPWAIDRCICLKFETFELPRFSVSGVYYLSLLRVLWSLWKRLTESLHQTSLEFWYLKLHHLRFRECKELVILKKY